MTDFEKALEDEFNNEAQMAYKWAEKHLKQKTPSICYEYGVKAGFQKGARWAREFTVSEICEWLKYRADKDAGLAGDFQVYMGALLANDIESHFTEQSTKDGGGE